MSAAYAQLQTTSNNIANAGTAGYSRQQAQLATSPGQFTGAGFFGRGVDVSTVTRAHDSYLTTQAAVTASQAASDSTRLDQLTQLQNIFASGDSGIGYAAANMLNAFGDVASAPSDSSARQVVLSDAKDVASRFQDAGAQLDTLQAGVTSDMKTSIASVNQLTSGIATLNKQIAAVKGLGQPPNDLLDQRDQLIQQLSGLVQVTTVPADDGSTSVFIAGGQQLVLGANATKLVAVQDNYDPAQFHVGVDDGSKPRVIPDDSLGGGSLAGLMAFQGKDLKDARNLLGQMATALASSVNQQQALGLDQSNPATAGAPIFSLPTPRVLPASGNGKDSAGNALATVSLAVTDASALQASDYSLQADPSTAGSYLVTRLSDGKQSSVANGATVDGFQINVGTPAPAGSDKFLLQPVGNAAGEIAMVLNDPKGIAAASPVAATMGANNTGTATVASLTAANSSLDPSAKVQISFGSAGAYTWQQTDAANVVTTGSGTWTAGSAISVNGFALKLAGAPKSGDTIAVNPATNTNGNNGNALAFVAMATQAMVGKESITDAYASAMSNIGVRVQSATTASTISGATASQAKTAQGDKAGVNLDEEAAKLIQFQQAYQASAKVLQVAQTLFDTLLQTASA